MPFQEFDAELNVLAGFRAAHHDALRALHPAPPHACRLRIAPGAGPGIVTKARTYAELGGPSVASVGFVLLTARQDAVHDGAVSLLGPDLEDVTPGTVLPFGQVVIAYGEHAAPEDYARLTEAQYVQDCVEGYMVRSRPGSVWGRVSQDAVARGFDLAFLGRAIIELVKTQVPGATAAEVLFVTSSDTHVHALTDVNAQVAAKARGLRRRLWAEKGIDVTGKFSLHCGACTDRPVCVEVRRVSRLRRSQTTPTGDNGRYPPCN